MARQQPAEKVQARALDRIKPYPNNPRTHSDEQIARLAELIMRYGVDQPIVVDEKGVILKGHGRRLAAMRLGLKTFPVVVQRGLSAEEKRALRIADNQVTLMAEWDADLLKLEVADLKLAGFDLPSLGFSAAALNRFAAANGGNDTSPQLSGLSYAVIVRCQDEIEQKAVLERLTKDGLKVEALIS